MRSIASFGLVLPVLLLLSFWVESAQGQMGLEDLSECSLTCLVYTVPAAGCSLLDTECQCRSTALAQSTAACLLANCTMTDSLLVAKVQASQCNLPNPSRSNETIWVISLAFGVAATCVVFRLVSKNFSKMFYFDDILILAAVLIAIVPMVCAIAMAKLGYGKHLWGLEDGDLLKILRYLYIAENAYIVVLCLTKLSLVWFYLRIFPYPAFRIPAYITLAFLILSSIIILVLTILSCLPIPLFWNKDIKHGKCLNINALAYANAGLSIVQDLIILALPISMLPRLNMSLRKKITVGIMFALGSFGCVTSIIRLHSLLVFGNSIDPSWDYVPVVYWTTMELAVGVVCACLPSMRKLLAQIFPKIFKFTTHSNSAPPIGLDVIPKGSKRSYGDSRSWELISDDPTEHTNQDRSNVRQPLPPPPPPPAGIMMRNSVTITHEVAPKPSRGSNETLDGGQTFLNDPSSSSSARSVFIT